LLARANSPGVWYPSELWGRHSLYSFRQGHEEFLIQAFVAQLVMEALDIPVFPWTAGRDVEDFELLSQSDRPLGA